MCSRLDAMGRLIVEDDMSRMMPKTKINSKDKWWRLRLEMLNQPKADMQAVGEAKSGGPEAARKA